MADLGKVITTSAVGLARDQVGYKEGRRNWTIFARDDYPTVQNQAWCGSFVGWVYARAGFDVDPYVWVPYVPYIENWARENGLWRTDRAQAGDIVVYGFGRSSGQHTGIAWPDESTGGDSYRAIEGNTSSGNGGSQTNGDGVYVRYRSRSTIRGWVDMSAAIAHYGTGTKPKPPAPSPAPAGKDFADVDWTQRTLNELGYAAGTVDGVVGTKTTAATRAFQTDYGITADGRPGPDTRTALEDTVSKIDQLIKQTSPAELQRSIWGIGGGASAPMINRVYPKGKEYPVTSLGAMTDRIVRQQIIPLRGEVAGLSKALDQLSLGQGIDPDAIQKAVRTAIADGFTAAGQKLEG